MAIAHKVKNEDLTTRQTERLVQVVKDPTVSEPLKKAILEQPKVTPDHVDALKTASPKIQASMISQIKHDLVTVRDVQDAVKEEQQTKVVKLPDEEERNEEVSRATMV